MNSVTKLPPHLPRLDVLRGFAILSVFLVHFYEENKSWSTPWQGNFHNFGQWHFYAYPLIIITWGSLGVPLFFVLSGFCIHYGYLRRPASFSTWEFLKRRFWRIYPAYLASLVVFFALMRWIPSQYKGFQQLIPHLLLIHNLNKSTFFGIAGVYWTLGLEWQFYLLFPLLLWLRQRWGLTYCLIFSLGLNLIIRLYITLSYHGIDGPSSVSNAFPLAVWCCWILGACVAESYGKGTRLFSRGFGPILISSLALFMALNYKPFWTETIPIAAVFFAILMEKYLQFRSQLNPLESLIAPIGIVSYSVYLWHQPIMSLICRSTPLSFYAQNSFTQTFIVLPIVLLIVAPISILSYIYIEQFFQRWSKSGSKKDLKIQPQS